MRRFLTIGITPSGEVDVLTSADKEKREHVEGFNDLAKAAKGKKAKKSKYAEIQVIDLSRGIVKRKRNGEVDGGGKRTVARIVKKRKRAAKKVAKKKSARVRKPVAKSTPKKSAASAKSAVKPAAASASESPKPDEGLFPTGKPAGE